MPKTNYRSRRDRRKPEPGGVGSGFFGVFSFEIYDQAFRANAFKLRPFIIDPVSFEKVLLDFNETDLLLLSGTDFNVKQDGVWYLPAEFKTESGELVFETNPFVNYCEIFLLPSRRTLKTGTGYENAPWYGYFTVI